MQPSCLIWKVDPVTALPVAVYEHRLAPPHNVVLRGRVAWLPYKGGRSPGNGTGTRMGPALPHGEDTILHRINHRPYGSR